MSDPRASIVLLSIAAALGVSRHAQEPTTRTGAPSQTRLIMLGTGNPGANPDRFGPATVVLVDRVPYLVDAGAGVMRRWTAAIRKYNLELGPAELKTASSRTSIPITRSAIPI